MIDPNLRQVGGDHYNGAGAVQHWDIIELHAIPYLEGNATKYLARWHRKNGQQDLEKALHYVEKLISMVKHGWRTAAQTIHNRGRRDVPEHMLWTFAQEQHMGEPSVVVMRLLLGWTSVHELHEAQARITHIIHGLTVVPTVGKTEQPHPFGYDAEQDS